jgi:hypothetical protein
VLQHNAEYASMFILCTEVNRQRYFNFLSLHWECLGPVLLPEVLGSNVWPETFYHEEDLL